MLVYVHMDLRFKYDLFRISLCAQFGCLDVKSSVIDEFEYKIAYEWKVIM